jgi:hypothetical protein
MLTVETTKTLQFFHHCWTGITQRLSDSTYFTYFRRFLGVVRALKLRSSPGGSSYISDSRETVPLSVDVY